MSDTFTAIDMLNTVLAGLAIVFAVLIIIFIAMKLMQLFFYTIPNRRSVPAASGEQTEAEEPVTDDEEEAAAVIAVIAADMGPGHGNFRVNQLQRRK